jgi:hypothetical protein
MTSTAPVATLLQDNPRQEAPGVAIEAVFAPGECAAGRIIVHEGLTFDEQPFGARVTARAASCFHFAFYSQALLENQCEPYDQPSHAAYLPLAYSSLRVLPIDGYGALLLQRNPSSRADEESLSADGIVSLLWTVADEAELREALCEVADLAGVPAHAMSALPMPAGLLSSPAA